MKDNIENEVNELTSVLDEMQTITGREIFKDIKKQNLKKGSNALNKEIIAQHKKFSSQR